MITQLMNDIKDDFMKIYKNIEEIYITANQKKYKKYRFLLWNTLVNSTDLFSNTRKIVFIDNLEKLKNNDGQNIYKSILKHSNNDLKNEIQDNEYKFFKIKISLDNGFDKYFIKTIKNNKVTYYKKEDCEKRILSLCKKIKTSIETEAELFKYDIEIKDIFATYKNDFVNEIHLLVKENDIEKSYNNSKF